MIKVLFFELSFEFGGIESFLLNLVGNTDLNNHEIQFDFVSCAPNPAGNKAFVSAGVNVIKLHSKKNLRMYRKDLNALFKNGNYDVVHIQKNSLSNSLPIKYAKKYNVPYIIHAQNSASSRKSIITDILHRYNKNRYEDDAYKKFACGEQAAKWMFSKLDDVVYIQNGINPEDFKLNIENRRNIRNKYNINDNLVLCHVGRFTKNKNHMFIIDVFYELKKLLPQSKLFLVGDGEEFENVKQYVYEKQLESDVIFFGSLDRTNESKVLQASDIFILPSLYEGVSIASIEAQMAGLWLIVSDTVDNDTNVTNNVYFKSLEDGPKDWAEYIKENYSRKDYDYNELIQELRSHRYDMKYTTDVLLNIYREAKKDNYVPFRK